MTERAFVPFRFAVLTVSDSRDAASDRSGDTLAQRIAEAGHVVAARAIVADEQAVIEAQLRAWIGDPAIQAIISTGGTGMTGRDVTIEAHRAVYEKEMPGFGILFTLNSLQSIGTLAIQSRATAGVAGGTWLFALPGSTGACREGWDRILRPQFDARESTMNFVALTPRLTEHRRPR